MWTTFPVPEALRGVPDGVYYLGRHYTRAKPLTPQILDAYCCRCVETGREAAIWGRLRVLASQALWTFWLEDV
jgi:hypothetical protein